MIANLFRKKGSEAVKPDDLILFDPDKVASDRMAPKQIMAHLKWMTKSMGGKVIEK